MKTTKRRGKGDAPHRVAMSMRISPAMRDMVTATAQLAGRSLSQEIELRLEQSYRHQGLLEETLATTFGPKGGELLMVLGRLIRHAPGVRGLAVEDDWTSDPVAYRIAETEVNHALELRRPPGRPLLAAVEKQAKERATRLLVAERMIDPPEEWKEETGQ